MHSVFNGVSLNCRVVEDWVLFTCFQQAMVALLEIAVAITVMLIAFTLLQSVE